MVHFRELAWSLIVGALAAGCGGEAPSSEPRRDPPAEGESEPEQPEGGSTGGEPSSEDTGETTGGAPADDETPPGGAFGSSVRPLTRAQLRSTLEEIFEESMPFVDDYTMPDDWTPGEPPSPQARVESAMLLADAVLGWIDTDPTRQSRLAACDTHDRECLDALVGALGPRFLRRPLAPEHQAALVELGEGSARPEYAVVAALLQDPAFLYRIEVGEPDGEGGRRLDPHEIASRMAFLIWGRGPDRWLHEEAEAGRLDTPEDVQEVARAMLLDPSARERADRFHAYWLGLGRANPAGLGPQMRTESAALVERILFDENRPWVDLLTEPEMFVGQDLAAHYGLPWSGDGSARWVADPAGRRIGFLGQGSILAAGAKFDDTSPTVRGRFILERLLCRPLDPPSDANVDRAPAQGSASCKAARYQTLAEGACGSCHLQTDPLGFGLEQFDRDGQFRTHEPGREDCPVDGAGEIAGLGSFAGVPELAALLAAEPEVEACMVDFLLRFEGGVLALDPATAEFRDSLLSEFEVGELRYADLLVELVGRPEFVRLAEEL